MFLDLIELPNFAPDYSSAPPRCLRPFWMYCSAANRSSIPLFIYGPRHQSSNMTIPTSLYVLPVGQRTPRFWDCKGILIPLNQVVHVGRVIVQGPLVLKYRDMRRPVARGDSKRLWCSPASKILGREQDEFPIPNLSSEEISKLPRRSVYIP